MRQARMTRFSNKGFSLIEVLFAAGILAFVLCGLLVMYVNLFLFGDISRQTTLAVNAAQAKLEELKNTNFDSIISGTFTVNGFAAADAMGVVEVANAAPYSDLKIVRVVISFRQQGQRIVGEDRNLNGVWDAGEDTMINNSRLDSPIEVVTLISK